MKEGKTKSNVKKENGETRKASPPPPIKKPLTNNSEHYKRTFENIPKETDTFVSDFVDIIERLRKENEVLQKRIEEMNITGYKMLCKNGNTLYCSRSGKTFVFECVDFNSVTERDEMGWRNIETSEILDPTESFEIYKFEVSKQQ